ncbi:MAG TPA: hypothetical protein VLZ11_08215 [Flavobacterium sp.]|nr:hypothetical protein [Flavobacterium sp.]
MASESLERKTRNYSLKLKKNKNYVAMVVGAEFSRSKNVNQSKLLCSSEMVSKLEKKLKTLGTLYTKRNGNTIGCCAEVNAGNDILRKKPYLNLDEIIFSTPIRPRTQQKMKMCNNCKQTFR